MKPVKTPPDTEHFIGSLSPSQRSTTDESSFSFYATFLGRDLRYHLTWKPRRGIMLTQPEEWNSWATRLRRDSATFIGAQFLLDILPSYPTQRVALYYATQSFRPMAVVVVVQDIMAGSPGLKRRSPELIYWYHPCVSLSVRRARRFY